MQQWCGGTDHIRDIKRPLPRTILARGGWNGIGHHWDRGHGDFHESEVEIWLYARLVSAPISCTLMRRRKLTMLNSLAGVFVGGPLIAVWLAGNMPWKVSGGNRIIRRDEC